MSPAAPHLTLYVAGDSAASRRARVHLAAALKELHIGLAVRVVDVLVEPDEALTERIYVTPALVLQVNGRREMLVGDLSQKEAVISTLGALSPGADGAAGASQ